MEIPQKKTRVKVCVNVNCCQRGSEQVYEALLKNTNASIEVVKTGDCFRFCKSGPNVSVDGALLHGVRPSEAVNRVNAEIAHPSRKTDGLGTKGLSELDSVLDDLFLA